MTSVLTQHYQQNEDADDSRVSKAFSGVCVWFCMCMCLSVCTGKYQNGWNCNHQTCHKDSPSRVLAHQVILDQKVNDQGHRVAKCNNTLKAIEWSAWVMYSIECLASSEYCTWLVAVYAGRRTTTCWRFRAAFWRRNSATRSTVIPSHRYWNLPGSLHSREDSRSFWRW